MGQRKTRNIADSDADLVALCDVSCMAHINGLLERQAQRCRAVHIAEILNNQVDVEARPTSVTTTQPPPAPRRWQNR
jgi:L-lactate dehydrogenase complex protein LldE